VREPDPTASEPPYVGDATSRLAPLDVGHAPAQVDLGNALQRTPTPTGRSRLWQRCYRVPAIGPVLVSATRWPSGVRQDRHDITELQFRLQFRTVHTRPRKYVHTLW